MSVDERLQDFQRLLDVPDAEGERDIFRAAEVLLDLATSVDSVHVQTTQSGDLIVEIGPDVRRTLRFAEAGSLFRMVLARLAVVGNESDPPLYGGTLSLVRRGRSLDLAFKNSPGGQWLRVTTR